MTDLQLPHDAQLLAEPALVERLQIDDMREARHGLVGRTAREPLSLDVGHRPRRATNLDHLPGLRNRRTHRGRRRHAGLLLRGCRRAR